MMALFSAFKQLFDCFIPFWHRRETQQCAAQELAAVNKCSESEACNFTANPIKCRKKRCKGAKKCGGVKELHTPARPSVLKPIKGKLPKLPSGSGDFIDPAARFKPLPPVKRTQRCSMERTEQEFVLPGCPFNADPPKLLAVPPRPVHAPDELFSQRFSSVDPLRPILVQELEHKFVLPGCPIEVHPPKQLAVHPCLPPAPDELFSTVSPIPPRACAPLRSVCSLSSLESQSSDSVHPLDLMFADIEDEESEFRETIQTLLKPQRFQRMRQMLAWEEKVEEKVQDDESWRSKVFEFQEAGDSEAEHDIASLFCVTPFDGAESKLSEKVLEEPKNRRKVPMILFTWAEEKVKEKVERTLQKERVKRERELLHHRYRNDPKLKHLWINKHNCNYRSC